MIPKVTSCCNKPDGWLTWSEFEEEAQRWVSKKPSENAAHRLWLAPYHRVDSLSNLGVEIRSPLWEPQLGTQNSRIFPVLYYFWPVYILTISDRFKNKPMNSERLLCWLFNARTFDSNSLLRAHHPKITNYVVT